jgi:ABC-2 type transport system permease protein
MSAYQGVEYIRNNPNAGFMAIFSGAQASFSFAYLMVFFGPIIGLALGFDAINKERTSGSLSVLLAQPIYRDSVINGKFLGGIAALSLLTVSTIAIICGAAVPLLGFGPTLDDISRITLFTLLTVLYLAFWLGLGILYSTVTKKTSTSMLMSVATWLFCAVVITIIAMLVANMVAPIHMPTGGNATNPFQSPEYRELLQKSSTIQTYIQRISPAYLYSEAASSILGVATSTFGFTRLGGGTPFQLPELSQGLITSWPQITALAVLLIICFVTSYMLFLRQEIRPGG